MEATARGCNGADFPLDFASELVSCRAFVHAQIAARYNEHASHCSYWCRLNLVAQTICLICEIGIVCGTLMHLFSLRSTRRVIGDQFAEADITKEITLSFVSLFAALLGLSVLLVGTSRAYQAFVDTWAKIRHSTTNRCRLSTHSRAVEIPMASASVAPG